MGRIVRAATSSANELSIVVVDAIIYERGFECEYSDQLGGRTTRNQAQILTDIEAGSVRSAVPRFAVTVENRATQDASAAAAGEPSANENKKCLVTMPLISEI